MSKKLNKFHIKWMFWNSVLSITTALIPLYFLFEMRKIALPGGNVAYTAASSVICFISIIAILRKRKAQENYTNLVVMKKIAESGLNDDIERAINADTPEEKKELSEYIAAKTGRLATELRNEHNGLSPKNLLIRELPEMYKMYDALLTLVPLFSLPLFMFMDLKLPLAVAITAVDTVGIAVNLILAATNRYEK